MGSLNSFVRGLLTSKPGMVITLVAALIGTTTIGLASAAATGVIDACVNNSSGTIKIVSATTQCSNNEIRLVWNAEGSAGLPGATGATGAVGPTGATGATGPTGSFSFAGNLPSGQTLTGTFLVFATAAAANDLAFSAVSFPVALAQAPTAVHYVVAGGQAPAECQGSASSPQAAPGHLCVYETFTVFNANTRSRLIFDQIASFGPAASRYGFAIELSASNPGIVYSAGSWAVTAP